MSLLPQQHTNLQTYTQYQISQQQTVPQSTVTPLATPSGLFPTTPSRKKRMLVRLGIFLLIPVLVGIFVVIWFTGPPTTISGNSSQQNFSSSPSTSFNSNSTNSTSSSSNSGGNIQVYIVGAVKHPGVYTLPADARVYALLQTAGGPLPKANLVAINLAAKLTDGEEVYVTVIGEIPPTYMGGVPGSSTANGTPTSGSTGQLVNINTASVDQLKSALHVSSTTAQNIVNYRLQNGPYTSIDQLLQVVSKEIYDKIKGEVTI